MPNPVEDNPALAAAIGRATSFWAHAEIHLASLFGFLSGLDHTMAVTIFSHFKNTSTQCDVLMSVARASERCEAQDLEEISAALKAYRDLAGRRNAIVHNPLGWEPDKSAVYRMQREKVSRPGMYLYSKAPVTVAEIDELSSEIKTVVSLIANLGTNLPDRWRSRLMESMKSKVSNLPPFGILGGGFDADGDTSSETKD